MNFFEYKKQAEVDGMDVKTNTKKADIDYFYAHKNTIDNLENISKNDECPFCGMKLYHNFCNKHGRIR